MSRTNHPRKKSYAPTQEDRYKSEVEKMQPTFKKIEGCKLIKVTIPKDCCGNADDAYTLHFVDAHHNSIICKISSSEWIHMQVVE